MFHSSHSDSYREAQHWCEKRAVDTHEALAKITGSSDYESVRNKYSSVFEYADKKKEACPVEMGGRGDLNILYHTAEHVEAKKVVETGVAHGWSALALLLSLDQRSDARLVSTDMPYIGRNNEPYVGHVVPRPLRARWQVIRRADREALPKALDQIGTPDLCHYDSDKTYEGRIWAYPLLWRALRKGGALISDDVGDNTAFRDFCASIKRDPVVVRKSAEGDTKNDYVGVATK